MEKIQLGRIFTDGMILQCEKPVKIWGSSQEKTELPVLINGTEIKRICVDKGAFSFVLPPQEAQENAVLQIGDLILRNVDFGEVFLAGGQSNMEFLLKYDVSLEKELEHAEDAHLRYYEVGKYQFLGEREEGIVSDPDWDCWKTGSRENIPQFSAVAWHFAKEMRKTFRIPVGIVSCNYGGTTASSWMDPAELTGELAVYRTEYEEKTKNLDMEEYLKMNRMLRAGMASPESKKVMSAILYGGEKLKAMMAEMQQSMKIQGEGQQNAGTSASETSEDAVQKGRAMMQMTGPHDKNRPGGLYESMLSEVSGYGIRGVLWYQGETDEIHPHIYVQLMGAMIRCWRRDWGEELPFFAVQLAPYGTWMGSNGEKFPILRRQQEIAVQTEKDVFLISSSDVGDASDIHPKQKEPIGHRLALAVRSEIFGEPVQWKAPKLVQGEQVNGRLALQFDHADGMYVNGESVQDLHIFADGKELEITGFEVQGSELLLEIPEICKETKINVEYACTGYYEVNLYNQAGIPAMPASISVR